MLALFNFQSLLTVVLLLICTCAYIRSIFPSLLDRNKTGQVLHLIESSVSSYRFCGNCGNDFNPPTTRLLGIFWKAARVGERKSPWVAASCVLMAVNILCFS